MQTVYTNRIFGNSDVEVRTTTSLRERKYVLRDRKTVLLVNHAMENGGDDHVANSTITLSPRFVLRGRLPEYMIEHINKYELGGGNDCQVSLMIIFQVLGADEYCFTIRV